MMLGSNGQNALPRLAFLVPSLGEGGVGKMRIHLMGELLERGYSVDLLLKELTGPYKDMLDARVRVFELGSSHAWMSLPRLIAYLRRQRPYGLITDRLRVNVAAHRARRWARVPTRICTSVHIVPSQKLERLSPSKRLSEYRAMQRYYPLNQRIISVSKGIAEDLRRLLDLSAEQVAVVYNPVITADLYPLAQEPLDHPWFENASVPVILSAGRFVEQKDFATLIRAFARLRKKRPCRLMILGQGVQRAALEALAHQLDVAEDLALPGFVTNPYQYMARCRLFALSSVSEPFGNVLVEALALGTSCVSTDCPYGPREILQSGRFGALVPVGDDKALAKAMEEKLDNPSPAEELKREAARFTAKACAAGYLRALGLQSD